MHVYTSKFKMCRKIFELNVWTPAAGMHPVIHACVQDSIFLEKHCAQVAAASCMIRWRSILTSLTRRDEGSE